jgi:hypothetical protein
MYTALGPGFPPFEKFKYGHFRKILILELVKIKSNVNHQKRKE